MKSEKSLTQWLSVCNMCHCPTEWTTTNTLLVITSRPVILKYKGCATVNLKITFVSTSARHSFLNWSNKPCDFTLLITSLMACASRGLSSGDCRFSDSIDRLVTFTWTVTKWRAGQRIKSNASLLLKATQNRLHWTCFVWTSPFLSSRFSNGLFQYVKRGIRIWLTRRVYPWILRKNTFFFLVFDFTWRRTNRLTL